MQDLGIEATIQAISTVWGLDTAPNILMSLHQFECTASIVVIRDSEKLTEESKDKIINKFSQE